MSDLERNWTYEELDAIQRKYPRGYTTTLDSCSRCGQMHEDIEFSPLNNPSDEWMFYALCPNTSQPVLGTLAPKPKTLSGLMAKREEDSGKKEG